MNAAGRPVKSSDVDVLKLMRFLRLCSKNDKNNHVREVIQSALPFSKDLEHASANQHGRSALRMYSFLVIRLVLIFHLYWLHNLGRNHRNFKCIPDSQAGPGPASFPRSSFHAEIGQDLIVGRCFHHVTDITFDS